MKLGTIAIFIGEIIDGVKKEYEEALSIGVRCILID
jgi:hypothetical protein